MPAYNTTIGCLRVALDFRSARNHCNPGSRHDIWEINEENECREEKQLPLPMHADPAEGES